MTRAAQASQRARPSVKTMHWMREGEREDGEIVALLERGDELRELLRAGLQHLHGHDWFVILRGLRRPVSEKNPQSFRIEGSFRVFELWERRGEKRR